MEVHDIWVMPDHHTWININDTTRHMFKRICVHGDAEQEFIGGKWTDVNLEGGSL